MNKSEGCYSVPLWWCSLIFKDLVQFFRTGEVRRSLGAYQWHPSAEFAGWGVPAHKGRSINAWNCCRPLKHAFFSPNRQSFCFDWLIHIRFFFPQVSGKFRAELQKEELKNRQCFPPWGRSTKACGNIQIHRENVRKWRTWGPCFGDQVYQPRKRSAPRVLGCSFYKDWWLDDCSSCGCLAFGAVFRGGDCFGSKKDDCWLVPDADLCLQNVSQMPI